MRNLLLLGLLLVLTACGFQLRGRSDLLLNAFPKIYVASQDPYGSFNKTFLDVLKHSGVELVKNRADAVYILEIQKPQTTIQSVGYGFSNQVSMNTITETLAYRMQARSGRELIPWRTISTVNSFTINTNQALSGTVVPDYLTESMNRDLVYQLIEQLNAWESNENQPRSTHKPAF